MSSGNWVIDNLNNALQTWNDKMSEIWLLVTQSPTEFKGGGIWNVIVNIHGALQATGFALLVLFFVIGVVKTCGSFAEVKTHYRIHKKYLRIGGQSSNKDGETESRITCITDGLLSLCKGKQKYFYISIDFRLVLFYCVTKGWRFYK